MDNNINILKWYPFKENSRVLEIYKDDTILDKIGKNLDLDKQYIENLKLTGKYDYIVLIGSYEYAPTILNEEMPYSVFLKNLKEYLNEDGKILIAIDNRLGIKYFAGAKSKYYSKVFQSIENEIRQKKPNLLLKTELEKFIRQAGFENYKFYYPVPDYKNTNSIFTDEFLPKSNNSKILYPLSYEDGSMIIFNETDVMKQICDNNIFKNLTNSYFVEIGIKEIKNNIKFVNYNILRKDKYKLILTIDDKKVKKIPKSEETIDHIKNIKEYLTELQKLGFTTIETIENNEIISNFIDKKELDKIIVEQIEQENIEKALDEIKRWYKYIENRLEKVENNNENLFKKLDIDVPIELMEKMNFVKQGYIDLAFENVFCDGDDYIFYDQEWKFENIPIEFILYRAINNLYTYNSRKIENKIDKEEMYDKFKISEFTVYFEKLEKYVQNQILDEEKIKEYREKLKGYYRDIEQTEKISANLLEENKKISEENENILEENRKILEKYEKIKIEKEEIQENNEKLLQQYNNSRAWKLIKRVRRFLGKEN